MYHSRRRNTLSAETRACSHSFAFLSDFLQIWHTIPFYNSLNILLTTKTENLKFSSCADFFQCCPFCKFSGTFIFKSNVCMYKIKETVGAFNDI